jgi:2'-5' RNA ligase
VRLFVAIVPPPPALAHLAAAVAPLRATAPSAVRWTPAERQHLTLVFLGEVDEDRVDRVGLRLAEALDGRPPPVLQIAGAGRFGRQVLWAGLAGDVELLRSLARAAARGVRAAGVALERRAYQPHLTLARTRGPADLAPLVEALAAYEGPAWTAGQVLLMASVLGPHPEHRPVLPVPLHAG